MSLLTSFVAAFELSEASGSALDSKLFHVRPAKSAHNVACVSLGHPKPNSQLRNSSTRREHRPHLADNFIIDFGVRVRGALVVSKPLVCPIDTTPLKDSVSGIFSISAQPKMRRVATRRIVASVTNEQSFWDNSIGVFPCDSMGRGITAAPDTSAPVAVGIAVPLPFPALIWSSPVNKCPESILRFSDPSSMSKSETIRLSFDMSKFFSGIASQRGRRSASTFAEVNLRCFHSSNSTRTTGAIQ